MKSGLSALALVLLVPIAAQAQSGSLAAGARVRITSPSNDLRKHVTTVTEVRRDSIVVAGPSGLRAVAMRDVTALEVSTGRRNQIVRHALIGFGTGLVGGFALGMVTYREPDMIVAGPAELGAIFGGIFGLAGLAVGGVIGATNHTDRWQPVQGFRASIAPASVGGVSVSLSRAF